MKEWKDVSSPVKEWISKHEQKIRSHGLIKNDHDAVAKQREDVEVKRLNFFQKPGQKQLHLPKILPILGIRRGVERKAKLLGQFRQFVSKTA